MIQRGLTQNLGIEGLHSLSGRKSHKSSPIFIGRLSEKMTPQLSFKGRIAIDHEIDISSRKNSNCQISQDGQTNVQY